MSGKGTVVLIIAGEYTATDHKRSEDLHFAEALFMFSSSRTKEQLFQLMWFFFFL